MAIPPKGLTLKSASQRWAVEASSAAPANQEWIGGEGHVREGTGSTEDLNLAPAGQRAQRWRPTPGLWLGGAVAVTFLLVSLLAPVVAPFSPDQVATGASLQVPSSTHPFGTDLLGRDVLSRVLYGARIALGMSLLGVGISAALGVSFGLLAGYRGHWFDQVVSRLMDLWLAFPGLLLAIIIVARLGPSLQNATIALGLVGVPAFYRLMRGSTLCARRMAYVEAAQSVGAGHGRIMVRHILPNVASPLIVLVAMRMGILILSGGALSFIGLGAQPPTPEWGALLADGRNYMDIAPWLAVFPGICITITVAGLNLLGDGLRDTLNPR